jgi:hypothetical protein
MGVNPYRGKPGWGKSPQQPDGALRSLPCAIVLNHPVPTRRDKSNCQTPWSGHPLPTLPTGRQAAGRLLEKRRGSLTKYTIFKSYPGENPVSTTSGFTVPRALRPVLCALCPVPCAQPSLPHSIILFRPLKLRLAKPVPCAPCSVPCALRPVPRVQKKRGPQ